MTGAFRHSQFQPFAIPFDPPCRGAAAGSPHKRHDPGWFTGSTSLCCVNPPAGPGRRWRHEVGIGKNEQADTAAGLSCELQPPRCNEVWCRPVQNKDGTRDPR